MFDSSFDSHSIRAVIEKKWHKFCWDQTLTHKHIFVDQTLTQINIFCENRTCIFCDEPCQDKTSKQNGGQISKRLHGNLY